MSGSISWKCSGHGKRFSELEDAVGWEAVHPNFIAGEYIKYDFAFSNWLSSSFYKRKKSGMEMGHTRWMCDLRDN